MMIEAVFFDVGNTLLYPHPSVSEVCREVLRSAGHDRDLDSIESIMPLVDAFYEDRYREDDSFWTDEGETSSVWVGMYSLLCRKLGIAEEAEVLARRVYDEFGRPDRWRTYPDVLPAFARLKERGVKVGIISNWDRRLASLLEGLGFGGLVDGVISSAVVGLRKPDPRIFELACKDLGVEVTRSAHVGDHHYSDILGASSVGMTALLIDRHGVEESSTVLSCLDDLERFLGWED